MAPIDLQQLNDEVGPPQFLKVALDGNWETGLVLELNEDSSAESIESFIDKATNVAFQIFFKSPSDSISFVGIRLNGKSKADQASIILTSLQSVRVGGWSSFNKVVNGLRLLIADEFFPPHAHLLEVGVVGSWKSVGSAVIWRNGESELSQEALLDSLQNRPALLDVQANPIGLEFGFDSPLPHWIALQISDVDVDGHRLNIERLHNFTRRNSQ